MTEHADDDVHSASQEFLANADQTTMAYSATQNAAQHIAAAFVRRQNAVADHKGHAASMVGDNLQGYVSILVLAVFHAGDLASIFNNGEH